MPIEINFARRHDRFEPPTKKKRTLLVLTIGIMIAAGFFYFIKSNKTETTVVATSGGAIGKIVDSLASVVRAGFDMDGDRVNFLLTGIGGAEHDGATLTDTMVVLSIKPKTGEVAMISLPRDLVVPIPGYGFRKINSVNALAEANEKNSGPEFTRHFLQNLLAIKIPYYVQIDFDGFKKLIDRLGGLTIMVDKSFADSYYPTDDYLIKEISFLTGVQKMDGNRVLQYVRSRHGNNGEGSDFARSRRQQKVITALKSQILNTNLLLNPEQIRAIFTILNDHVATNLEIGQIINLAKTNQTVQWGNLYSYVLDDRPTSPLYVSTETGSYMLLPKKGDYSDLRFIAKNLFSEEKLNSFFETSLAKVEVQNGTTVVGFAGTKAIDLQAAGFEIVRVANAKTNDFTDTFIYDVSGKKPEALKKLKHELSKAYIVQVDRNRAKEIFGTTPDADFVVILGKKI